MDVNFLRRFWAAPNKPLGGRYKIIQQLGVGGFGQTFLAEDLHLPEHPRCVVKQLKPQVTDGESLQIARRLFDTEAKVLYRLGSHDQIPRLLAHFEEDREFYLAQELIEGHSLSHELLDGKVWTETRVVALLQDILHTLAFVHTEQVIHRDLKPSNLIRRSHDGKVVLIDFGAVKQTSAQLANPDTGPTHTISIGTQGYMPNEQIAGNPRFSSDIYAVGMIGIQSLTGVSPRKLLQDPRTGEIDWHSHAEHIHPKLREFLDRMVRYDFRDRYATATEALDALLELPAPLLQDSALELPASEWLAVESLEESLESDRNSDLTLSTPNASSDLAAQQATTPLPKALEQPEVASTETLSHPPVMPSMAAARAATGATLPLAARSPTPALIPQQASRHHAHPLADRLNSVVASLAENPKNWLGVVAAITVSGILLLFLRGLFLRQPTPQTASSNAPEPELSQASPSTPPSPSAEALLTEAERLRTGNQYDAALKAYEQAIAQDPQSSAAQWGKCYSLNKLQQYQQAIAACDQAIALNPQNAQALWSKGYALDQQKQTQAALDLYNQSVAIDPNFAEAWSNRGTALLILGQPGEAIASFDKALALDSQLAEAWNNRGAALWSLRRFEEAVASVDKAIQIQPDYADALSLREQMRQRLGR